MLCELYNSFFGGIRMKEDMQIEDMIAGKEKQFSDQKFFKTFKKYGSTLGLKAMEVAATLYIALKSPDMPKHNKLIIAGALGYFILPLDAIADLLPLIGLTDDMFVISAALTKVYISITDDMKEDAKQLVNRTFGKTDVE